MWQPLSFLSSVYRLEALDTRLVTSTSLPYKPAAPGDEAIAHKKQSQPHSGVEGRAQPAKWKTPEFIFYYVFLIVVIPYMFWVAYDVSRPSDPRYPKYEHLLAPGWIPGRMIDASDPQYHTFRTNLPYMGALLIVHPLLRRLYNILRPVSPDTRSPTDRGEARLQQRVSFDAIFAPILLLALHGFSAFKVLLILYVNYTLATTLPKQHIPAATWIFNIGILFANELCSGYRFKDIATFLGSSDGLLHRTGEWMDSWGGILSRWEILFNITVLRLISFNLDYYWSLDRRSMSPIEERADKQRKRQEDPANLSERERVSTPAKPRDYSFRNYLAYAIYAPLYLAGPILTFNDYVAQQRHQVSGIETPRTLRYALRFVLALLAMEVVLHFDYVGAISQAQPVWGSYTAAQLSLLSYFNLHLIWMKLMLAWRLFRLWALLDGVDPPENIIRCVSNNYSTLSFWRAWHRSYNRWLIRYMYVPLGGADFRSRKAAARSIVTYLVIFTFVALWHDIQLRLLIWGWLIVLFFIPEVAAAYFFPAQAWADRPTAYRMMCAAGAVINVLMMMSANLVGFAVGLDGLESILKGIFHDFSGLMFLGMACLTLFVGIQIMFEVRESEMRKGIRLKC
ncbi:uncharacterized protein PpBr36_05697 [Pyricularia pennisetigena]|uniref:uncharacterized protein n=1 Tax=Pyricularia pennisetigena TaxID=1578925 RepID=UPI00114F5BE4|nr:uncharacterized protein PpBr36_05697 [Pyricularia pennisetigena]TLS23130.1 hypothetical protein PpBr36_05697 [Pyricularia pennisetigena]